MKNGSFARSLSLLFFAGSLLIPSSTARAEPQDHLWPNEIGAYWHAQVTDCDYGRCHLLEALNDYNASTELSTSDEPHDAGHDLGEGYPSFAYSHAQPAQTVAQDVVDEDQSDAADDEYLAEDCGEEDEYGDTDDYGYEDDYSYEDDYRYDDDYSYESDYGYADTSSENDQSAAEQEVSSDTEYSYQRDDYSYGEAYEDEYGYGAYESHDDDGAPANEYDESNYGESEYGDYEYDPYGYENYDDPQTEPADALEEEPVDDEYDYESDYSESDYNKYEYESQYDGSAYDESGDDYNYDQYDYESDPSLQDDTSDDGDEAHNYEAYDEYGYDELGNPSYGHDDSPAGEQWYDEADDGDDWREEYESAYENDEYFNDCGYGQQPVVPFAFSQWIASRLEARELVENSNRMIDLLRDSLAALAGQMQAADELTSAFPRIDDEPVDEYGMPLADFCEPVVEDENRQALLGLARTLDEMGLALQAASRRLVDMVDHRCIGRAGTLERR